MAATGQGIPSTGVYFIAASQESISFMQRCIHIIDPDFPTSTLDLISKYRRLTKFGPPIWQAEGDKEMTLVCFACHRSGPNSVNYGEILLEYGTCNYNQIV